MKKQNENKIVIAVAWQHGCRVTRITDKIRETIKFPTSKQAADYINRLKNVIIKTC